MTAANGSRTSPEKLNPGLNISQEHIFSRSKSRLTENGIHDMMRLVESRREVLGEWDIQVLQLCCESLKASCQPHEIELITTYVYLHMYIYIYTYKL